MSRPLHGQPAATSGTQVSYVLPLKAALPVDDEASAYLHWLAKRVDVVVVDASSDEVWQAHERSWGAVVRHMRVDPRWRFRNGKVNGVLTGLWAAAHERVILADDDVRYDVAGLDGMAQLLDEHDVVAPQNFYRPLPWPARYDTARTLVQRAVAHDFPGTLGIRRSVVRATGGYDGDVLFENLELMRTVDAAGGSVRWAPDLYVRRLPPDPRHFAGQRVRQAYDEFARPTHLAVSLAVLPGAALALARGRWRAVVGAAVSTALVAEWGRRRCGGRRYFPWTSSLLAPLWVAERGVCMWLAVLRRLEGGVPYGGRRLVRSASRPCALRRRLRESAPLSDRGAVVRGSDRLGGSGWRVPADR